MEQTNLSEVDKKLEILTRMVASLKEDFEDSFLTPEEERILEESREELKKGKAISLEDLKKELNEN